MDKLTPAPRFDEVYRQGVRNMDEELLTPEEKRKCWRFYEVGSRCWIEDLIDDVAEAQLAKDEERYAKQFNPDWLDFKKGVEAGRTLEREALAKVQKVCPECKGTRKKRIILPDKAHSPHTIPCPTCTGEVQRSRPDASLSTSREKIAKLCGADYFDNLDWEDYPEHSKNIFRTLADKIIALGEK